MAWIEIKLDNILTAKNISKREFARRVKTRHSTINDLCNNKVKLISLDKAALICDELNIELNDLMVLHKSLKKEEE